MLQIAKELDGLDGGRAVTKENVASWWTQHKAKTQKAQNAGSEKQPMQKSGESEAMEVEPTEPAAAQESQPKDSGGWGRKQSFDREGGEGEPGGSQ